MQGNTGRVDLVAYVECAKERVMVQQALDGHITYEVALENSYGRFISQVK